MKHTYIIAPFILLSACGSQQSSSEPSVPSESSIQLPSVTPSPVSTITVDQDANVTVAPGPVQPTSPIVATPLPDGVTPTPAQPNGTLTVFPDNKPEPTPTPTQTPCSQIVANGTQYDYTCGLWVLSAPQGNNCSGHATIMQLTQDVNGNWDNGSYVVTLSSGGGISWDSVSISGTGSGVVYETYNANNGRGTIQIPCVFTVSPAN